MQWPFILYGDSLTEMWKGTMGCVASSQRAGFDALRQQYLSPLSNADGMSGRSRRWLDPWLLSTAIAHFSCPDAVVEVSIYECAHSPWSACHGKGA